MKKFTTILLVIVMLATTLVGMIACTGINEVYNVTLDFNGGKDTSGNTTKEFINIKQVNPEDVPEFSRYGYTFLGWYFSSFIDEEDVDPITMPFIPSVDNKYEYLLLAKWGLTEGYADIKFNLNGGKSTNDTSYANQTVSIAEFDIADYTGDNAPSKEGYTFDGWYSDSALSVPYAVTALSDGDATIYAKYTPNAGVKVTIQLYLDGETPVNGDEYVGVVGQTLAEPGIPTRDGFYFGGWYKDSAFTTVYSFSTYPTTDTTVYVKWIGTDDFTQGLEYELNNTNDGYILVGLGDVTETTIYVPYSYAPENGESKPVVEISATAFTNAEDKEVASKIKVLYLPTTLTKINAGAFSGMKALNKISIPFVGTSASATGVDSVFGAIFGGVKFDGATAIAQRYDSDKNNLVCYYVPSLLVNVNLTNQSTVADYAFYNCEDLVSITLPDNVTAIGDYAFRGCSALASFKVPNSVTTLGVEAFASCTALKTVVLSDELTLLADKTFSMCVSLTTAYLGNKIESIGKQAFAYCTEMTAFNYNGTPALKVIGEQAFLYCQKLTTFKLGGLTNLTTISNGAFEDCVAFYSGDHTYSLKNKVYNATILPASLVSIGDSAFANCDALYEIEFEDNSGLNTIGKNAFFDCAKLYSIELSSLSALKSIGESAFKDCIALFGADEIALYGDAENNEFVGVILPKSLTIIGNNTFSGCTALATVQFELGSVNLAISESMFYDCKVLTYVDLGDAVTIGQHAFQKCPALKSLLIPDSVVTINEGIVDNEECIVFAEVTEKPAGWVTDWVEGATVKWAGQWQFKEGKPVVPATEG